MINLLGPSPVPCDLHKNPRRFTFPDANITASSPNIIGAALIICSPSFLLNVSTNLEKPSLPKPFKLFYLLYQPNHRPPTALFPISIATTTTPLFSHERPPRLSVKHCYPLYP